GRRPAPGGTSRLRAPPISGPGFRRRRNAAPAYRAHRRKGPMNQPTVTCCEVRTARRCFASAVVWLAALLVAAPAGAATLTRGPYLPLLTPNSVTIVWNTDTPAACSLAIRPVAGSSNVIQGGTGAVCAIPVDGLTNG